MNLCADQLAILLAGPGQLRSVSFLAADPRASAMAEAAREMPAPAPLHAVYGITAPVAATKGGPVVQPQSRSAP